MTWTTRVLMTVAAAFAVGDAAESAAGDREPASPLAPLAPLALPVAARVPWSRFAKSCERRLPQEAPLSRFWGTRPHPDLSMITDSALWGIHDPNLAILPKWSAPAGANLTIPFTDTHVAVRFLGGVSNFSQATAADCSDRAKGQHSPGGVDVDGIWCDLVVRQADGSLKTRFDLIHSRLDRYVTNGIDLMIVMDDVPWAFVNTTHEMCEGFGCQYLPPQSPAEFAKWMGSVAAYFRTAYGKAYASRIRWRLGTETNGPRWGGRGKYFGAVLASYKLAARSIVAAIPGAQVGASNWVEVVGTSGNLSHGGSDSFQHDFYSALAADPTVPCDWISVSHYGGGGAHGNFPGPDFVQRTPYGVAGELELAAMRELAERPAASLEVQEWSILKNELRQPTWEPSALGTAWSAASATTWMCHGVERIFHWETGTTLVNRSGDGRLVNFYEQWPWAMALLELFVGGRARFATHSLRTPDGNGSVAVIESVKPEAYFVLVAALGPQRNASFRTTVPVSTDAAVLLQRGGDAAEARGLVVEQYTMNSRRSVVETIVRELAATPGALQHSDGLPYDFGRLLTPEGVKCVPAGTLGHRRTTSLIATGGSRVCAGRGALCRHGSRAKRALQLTPLPCARTRSKVLRTPREPRALLGDARRDFPARAVQRDLASGRAHRRHHVQCGCRGTQRDCARGTAAASHTPDSNSPRRTCRHLVPLPPPQRIGFCLLFKANRFAAAGRRRSLEKQSSGRNGPHAHGRVRVSTPLAASPRNARAGERRAEHFRLDKACPPSLLNH